MSTDGPPIEPQGSTLLEGRKPQEKFDKMTHFAPLEHELIGSSFKIPGKNPGEKIFVNSDILASNESIRNNPDLLKPLGLINGELTQEQIRKGREKENVMLGYFSCFDPVAEIVNGEYAIDYHLANPDEDGKIPNNFVFQVRPINGVYDGENADCLKVFDQVKLSKFTPTYGEDKKQLFSINKNRETGTISLVYMPLANQAV